MAGIQNLEAIIVDLKAFAEAWAEAMEDGKVNWLDLPKFLKLYGNAKDAMQRFSQISAEVADLDLAEAQRLLVQLVDLLSALSHLFVK